MLGARVCDFFYKEPFRKKKTFFGGGWGVGWGGAGEARVSQLFYRFLLGGEGCGEGARVSECFY